MQSPWGRSRHDVLLKNSKEASGVKAVRGRGAEAGVRKAIGLGRDQVGP